MNLLAAIFGSSLGKKYLMALTGLVLLGFATGHLVGNLQVFGHPDQINGYAHFLQGLGPALWAVRLVLLACAVIHIWAAVQLTLENQKARPQRYAAEHVIQASLASRTMRITGVIVGAFLVYHLAHFTIGWAQTGTFKATLVDTVLSHDVREFGIPLASANTPVHDVYSMVFLGFSHPVVSLFYIVAVGLLSFHLLHGADSLFQSLGLRTQKWACLLKRLVQVYCVLYFLGNLAIPGLILTGIAKPAEGSVAHKVLVQKMELKDFVRR